MTKNKKKKEERYIDRWRREHPELRLYLSRDEYEFLKKLAESKGVSMKELVLSAVRGIYESSVVAGLRVAVEFLRRYAELSKRGEGFRLRDIVRGVYGDVNEGSEIWKLFEDLWGTVVEVERCEVYTFITFPELFYEEVMRVARELGLKNFEPALFTVPCSICGRPMLFTHGSGNWREVRLTLAECLSDWIHEECARSLRQRRIP